MNERELFIGAIQLDDPAARGEFLQRACATDATLRKRVESLLSVYDRAGSFPESPVARPEMTVDQPEARETPGALIGPYKLLQQIGEGGMGAVFMAEQTHPVQRKVAVKVIKAGMDSRQVVARFEAERQALALMDHVNIARVLDAGATESGRPYFVMELVHGVPITKYCDDNCLSPRARLELFVPVCQAIQHAHQKGIIHRDIKPSNVMVTLYDGKPVPKVIDFGVAKAIDQRLTERTLFTQYGAMVGTLEYMSPEQAEMSAVGPDTRSDIYSLGVLLYELLTGSTPLGNQRVREAAYAEVIRMIKEEEPPKPSTRLSDSGAALASISAQRHTEPAKLTKLVRGELDWIVMKCLEKDRNRRYETANSFAADLQRYLNDEPVQACPPSAAYRLRKFVRRNKGPVVAASMIVLLLVGGMVGTTWQALRATQAESLARDSEQIALAQKDKAQTNFELAKDAVDKFLNKVTANPKLNEKDFFQLRKELLETAVPFYQKFVEQQGGDPELEAARGRAYHRLGLVRDAMGEKESALSDYEAMGAIFAKLAAEFPGVPAYRWELAKSHNNRGNLLAALGKPGAAEAAFRTALKLKGQLADDFPSVPAYRREFAKSHNSLGLLLKDLGRHGEAEAAFRTALRVQEQLAPHFLSDPVYRQELAMSHNNLGILLKALRQREEAEAAHRSALKLYGQLAAEFPSVPAHRQDLAGSHNNLANLLGDLGQYEEAETSHRAAQELYQQLAAEFPSVPEFRQDWAMSLSNLGILLKSQGQREEAEAAYLAALKLREKLAADYPSMPGYAAQLANTYTNYGILVRTKGEPQAALDWFAKAIDALEPVLKKEPGLVAARQALRDTHWGRALALDLLERHGEAVQEWDRAIELDDGPNKAKFQYGRTRSLILHVLNQDPAWPLPWGWPRF